MTLEIAQWMLLIGLLGGLLRLTMKALTKTIRRVKRLEDEKLVSYGSLGDAQLPEVMERDQLQ